MTSEHFAQGITSRCYFGLGVDHSGSDAEAMLKRMGAEGAVEDDPRVKDAPASTFPIDSVHYKGNFELRMGVRDTQTIKDNQIVLKYVKNTFGSYNVYGKGTNEMGTFDIVGTLILQGRTTGQMQLFRVYHPPPALPTKADATDEEEESVNNDDSGSDYEQTLKSDDSYSDFEQTLKDEDKEDIPGEANKVGDWCQA